MNTYYDKRYFSSTDVGSESLLSQEMQAFGAKKVTLKKGGVEYKTDDLNAVKIVLNTRLSSRVYKYICSFKINHEKDIYKNALEIPWDNILTVKDTFKVKNVISENIKYKFKNTLFINQVLKDAIVDSFNIKYKKRPNVEVKEPDFNFLIYISGNKPFNVDIMMDLSTYPLYKRGYKVDQTEASIKETVAASILQTIKIKDSSNFIDSMCGAATFPIEAALIKYQISPSYIRIKNYIEKDFNYWSFLKSPLFKDKELITNYIKSLYIKEIKKDPNVIITGYDIDKNAYDISIQNIRKANLKDLIHIGQRDSTKESFQSKSIIFANMPYGERLKNKDLEELYLSYFTNLKSQKLDADIYALTSRFDIIERLGIEVQIIANIYNGNIKCQLFKFLL